MAMQECLLIAVAACGLAAAEARPPEPVVEAPTRIAPAPSRPRPAAPPPEWRVRTVTALGLALLAAEPPVALLMR